ncbi:jg10864 [Pararge aegeria aegeria]|uniref:Jg10864 protein n=1 Tax=Pararge aegeria aegeria TaxID=348720 RepID=A0A8S4QG99_9NEOP|nr:jg10864 [Pararge aegeria aegeria]
MRRHEASCAATCPVCSMRCGTRSALSTHARRMHARAAPILCAQCFLVLPSLDSSAAHALTHRQADRFVCGYDACILRFATRNDLLAHIRKCHSGELVEVPDPAPPAQPPPPIACDHCGRTYVNLSLTGYTLSGNAANGYELNGHTGNGETLNIYILNSHRLPSYTLNSYIENGETLNIYILNRHRLPTPQLYTHN